MELKITCPCGAELEIIGDSIECGYWFGEFLEVHKECLKGHVTYCLDQPKYNHNDAKEYADKLGIRVDNEL